MELYSKGNVQRRVCTQHDECLFVCMNGLIGYWIFPLFSITIFIVELARSLHVSTHACMNE